MGFKMALPVVLGYLPYGIAYGCLARQVGLDLWEVLLMSILVYAGTAQLIVVGMLQTLQPISSIILTTFLVNSRYLLLCAALAPLMKGWGKRERSVFAYYVSDETFAVLSTKFPQGLDEKVVALTVNFTGTLGWVLSSYLGYAFSQMIPDTKIFGLDFVLPAVFIALLFMLARNGLLLVVAVLSGALSLLAYTLHFPGFAVIGATVIASTVGVTYKKWLTKKSS